MLNIENIKKLIEESVDLNLLIEGRKEDARALVPNLSDEQFDILKNGDPTATASQNPFKYLIWMAKASNTKTEELPEFLKTAKEESTEEFLMGITDAVNAFNNNLNIIPADQRDINKYNLKTLFNFVSPFIAYRQGTSNVRKVVTDFSLDIFEGAYEVYSDQIFKLHRCVSIKRSCQTGKKYDLGWCLTGAGGSGSSKYTPDAAKYYFNNYLEQTNNLYFLEYIGHPSSTKDIITAIIYDEANGIDSIWSHDNISISEAFLTDYIENLYDVNQFGSGSPLLNIGGLLKTDALMSFPAATQFHRFEDYIKSKLTDTKRLDEFINLSRKFFSDEEKPQVAGFLEKYYSGEKTDLYQDFTEKYSNQSSAITVVHVEKIRRGNIDQNVIDTLQKESEIIGSSKEKAVEILKYLQIYYENLDKQKYQNVLYVMNQIDPTSESFSKDMIVFFVIAPIFQIDFTRGYLYSYSKITDMRKDYLSVLSANLAKPIFKNLRQMFFKNNNLETWYDMSIGDALNFRVGGESLIELTYGTEELDYSQAKESLEKRFKYIKDASDLKFKILDGFSNIPKNDITTPDFKVMTSFIDYMIKDIMALKSLNIKDVTKNVDIGATNIGSDLYGINKILYAPALQGVNGALSFVDDGNLDYLKEVFNDDTFSKIFYKAAGDGDSLVFLLGEDSNVNAYDRNDVIEVRNESLSRSLDRARFDSISKYYNRTAPEVVQTLAYIQAYLYSRKARMMFGLFSKDPEGFIRAYDQKPADMSSRRRGPASLLRLLGRSKSIKDGLQIDKFSENFGIKNPIEKSLLYAAYHYLILSYKVYDDAFKSGQTANTFGSDQLENLQLMVQILEKSDTVEEMINNITDNIMNGDYIPKSRYVYGNREFYDTIANTNSLVLDLKNLTIFYTNAFHRINSYMQNLFYIKNYLESLGTGNGMTIPLMSEYIDRKFKGIGDESGNEFASFLKNNYSKDDYELLSQEEDNIKIIKLAKQKYNEVVKERANEVRGLLAEVEKIDKNFTFLFQKTNEIQNKIGKDQLNDLLQDYIKEAYTKYFNKRDVEDFTHFNKDGQKYFVVHKFMPKLLESLSLLKNTAISYDREINKKIGTPEEFVVRNAYDEAFNKMREMEREVNKINSLIFIMKAADYQNKMVDNFLTLKQFFMSGKTEIFSIPFDEPKSRTGYSEDTMKNKFYTLPSDEFSLFKYSASSMVDKQQVTDVTMYSSDNRLVNPLFDNDNYGFKFDYEFLTKEEIYNLYEYVLQEIKI